MKINIKRGIFIIIAILFFFYGFSKLEIQVGEHSSDSANVENTEKIEKHKNDENIYRHDGEIKENIKKEVNNLIESMTLEEKVAQLFIVLPESLVSNVDCVTAAGEMTREAIDEIPVGGFIYLTQNLQSEVQVKEMLSNVQEYSINRVGVPAFLCIDEEGGSVARLSGTKQFGIPAIENMIEIGENKDYKRAKEVGNLIGEYLSDFGFNVNFAPVADVLTNPKNEVVKMRAFGNDAQIVSDMALLVKQGLEEEGIFATYKHFPGHGSTIEDSHEGYAFSKSTLEELKRCELIPFYEGIKEGVSFIMIGHISLPNIIGDDTPASMSNYMIDDLLRTQMEYDGIVVTDAMNMGAIAQQYSSSDAAVKAILAGVDIVLMPEDFKSAYQGVIDAVEENIISQERLDESLNRILTIKVKMKEEKKDEMQAMW